MIKLNEYGDIEYCYIWLAIDNPTSLADICKAKIIFKVKLVKAKLKRTKRLLSTKRIHGESHAGLSTPFSILFSFDSKDSLLSNTLWIE